MRFLRAKGSHVKKAAKQLRATLTWRAMLDVGRKPAAADDDHESLEVSES
jgi:hypothetical protein